MMAEKLHLETSADTPNSKAGTISNHHERFYFSDGNVIFQVGQILYCVHRYFFMRDSMMFAAMFSLPGNVREGTCDEYPIQLEGQEASDFDAFLSILYPLTFQEQYTVEEWKSCFRFARKWDFEPQRELAMKKLFEIATPVDKIMLGREFEEARGMLIDGFVTLAKRSWPPTLEEGRLLGAEDLVIIGQLSYLRRRDRPIQSLLETALVEEGGLDRFISQY